MEADGRREKEGGQRVLMHELTRPEYEAAIRRGLVLLPVGSTEQHGPHLPLGTDTYQVHEIAVRVARRVGAIVAPTIPYGYRSAPRSGGGEVFAGTTSLAGETLTLVVRDVLRALIRHGAHRIFVLDGHYENNLFLHEAIVLALADPEATGTRIVKAIWVDPIQQETLERAWPNGFPGWDLEHAGHLETSVMSELRPDLVRTHAIRDAPAQPLPPYDVYPQPAGFVPASGVLSSPATWSIEAGRLIVGDAVAGLVAIIEKEFA
jgi:creatinine amidohydrolase